MLRVFLLCGVTLATLDAMCRGALLVHQLVSLNLLLMIRTVFYSFVAMERRSNNRDL